MAAGKNASSELYAIWAARPRASRRMKSLAACLPAATQSPRVRRVGLRGGLPVATRVKSVAVDKLELAQPRARSALTTASGEVAHRRAHSPREEEPRPERPSSREREPLAELRRDVRGLAEVGAQLLDGGGEALALGLDVAADLLRGAAVTFRHRSSGSRSSGGPPRLPARAP